MYYSVSLWRTGRICEGQHPAAGQSALHPDGLLPGQSLQHPDQTAEPEVPAGNRTQSPGGKHVVTEEVQLCTESQICSVIT